MISRFSKTLTIPSGETTLTALVGPPGLSGRIHAIKYTPGTLVTGTDLTITGNETATPILIKANAGTSVVWFHPRAIPNKNTDGSGFTNVAADIHIIEEQVKVALAQAVAGNIGSIEIWVDDGRT